MGRATILFIVGLRAVLPAVSYTHLDVYKRQVLPVNGLIVLALPISRHFQVKMEVMASLIPL